MELHKMGGHLVLERAPVLECAVADEPEIIDLVGATFCETRKKLNNRKNHNNRKTRKNRKTVKTIKIVKSVKP
jgi:hypothetical protein